MTVKRVFVMMLVVFIITPCLATSRLMKLKDDRYLITHQKQSGFGGQGKAIRVNYEKAASLCVLLDYSWFEIRETESKGRGWRSGAGTTIEVEFYKEKEEGKDDDLLECKNVATEEQKKKMEKALKKMKE